MQQTRTLEEFRKVFKIWMERDWFADRRSSSEKLAFSIRDFINDIALGNTSMQEIGIDRSIRFPDITNLRITLEEFLSLSIRESTGDLNSMRSIFINHFCERVVMRIAHCIASEHGGNDSELLKDFNCENWNQWLKKFEDEEVVQTLTRILFQDLIAAIGKKSLYSFFVEEKREDYTSWGPRAISGIGKPLPTKEIVIDSDHNAIISVLRYDEDGANDGPVTGYEWNCQIVNSKNNNTEAAACGMLYRFDREDGFAIGGRGDLLNVADSVADSDVLQVSAFFKQHSDAHELIETGDLLFVWIWERHPQAQKGLGARCIITAIEDLKRRFKKVRTVIFDTRPAQFMDWSMTKEPPMIAVAKQAALESITHYVATLGIKGITVRHIYNRSTGDDHHAALMEIGQATMDRMGNHSIDMHLQEALDSMGWTRFSDELISLLESAGLSELGYMITSGEAHDHEIQSALVDIFLHQRIPFIPLSGHQFHDGDGAYLRCLFNNDDSDGMELIDDDEISNFINSLPNDIVVTQINVADFESDENISGLLPTWLITVKTETIFMSLTEIFTNIPKPHPVDATRYLR